MLSILILSGLSDNENIVFNRSPYDIEKIYLCFLKGLLLCNNINYKKLSMQHFNKNYFLSGTSDQNIIYAPKFNYYDDEKSKISFIYTDSIYFDSSSFMLSESLRNIRSQTIDKTFFVNTLPENSDYKYYSKFLLDNIRIGNNLLYENDLKLLYKYAESFVQSICKMWNKPFISQCV